jgi:hypothetical protein
MPRFSDKEIRRKAHALTEAWMWPNQEERTETSKEYARVLREILFEEMKSRDDEFNAMAVRCVEELLGDCNPMGKIIQVMHCDVDEDDIEMCLDRSLRDMLYGASGDVNEQRPSPEKVAEAKKQVEQMRGAMEAYLEEGVNPLAFSYKKLLSH